MSGNRFAGKYGGFEGITVPKSLPRLTASRVIVQEWVEGTPGPWPVEDGISMVRTGIKCCVNQVSVRLNPNTNTVAP